MRKIGDSGFLQNREARYHDLFAGSHKDLPQQAPRRRHVYHIYGVEVQGRSAIQQVLQEQGISTGIHYPIPVHLLPAFADLGYRSGDFPVAERCAQCELSLPMFAELDDEQQSQVASALRLAIEQL